jgi:hypothetical protein
VQAWPGPQVTPQSPQFWGSVWVEVQNPVGPGLQASGVASGHRQVPPTHPWPPVHAIPHPPQFAGSASVFTHTEPQNVYGQDAVTTMQVPATQACPSPQTWRQLPQFCGSVSVFAQ